MKKLSREEKQFKDFKKVSPFTVYINHITFISHSTPSVKTLHCFLLIVDKKHFTSNFRNFQQPDLFHFLTRVYHFNQFTKTFTYSFFLSMSKNSFLFKQKCANLRVIHMMFVLNNFADFLLKLQFSLQLS